MSDSSKPAKGKIVAPHARDNSSHKLPNTKGKSMGGSLTNLSHSLQGASANLSLRSK